MKALIVREQPEGTFTKRIEEKELSLLPDHDVLIEVHYAALNYKDALSASGHKGITKKYPHTPGVDAAGVIAEDKSGKFKVGEKVICTSYDLGMNTDGAFAEYILVPADWIVRLPQSMSLEESMIMGTAAYTAALALHKMERCGQNPGMGEIVVTGASGGVGSMAIAVLARAGYQVIASSDKTDQYEYLMSLGAHRCITRSHVNDTSGKPVLRSKWAGAIDNVGGNTLHTLIKACAKEGCIASIGLVESPDFNLTVYPFILNGVNLLGVDSAETKMETRQHIWNKLSDEWKPAQLGLAKKIVTLDEIPAYMDLMLKGKTSGRIVAKISN